MRHFLVVASVGWLVACASAPPPRRVVENVPVEAPVPATTTAAAPYVLSTATPADVAAPPTDAERSPTGLAWRVLRPGDGGARLQPGETFVVHYAGWTTDGKLFDASVDRGQPFRARPEQVIPGFAEGVSAMTVGEARRLWIPEALAYQGRPGAPAGTLVFDVELLAIEPARP